MTSPARFAPDNLLGAAAILGKKSVKTQFACEVLAVSEDGRFVDVIHNNFEYVPCADGDTVMVNEYGQDMLCAAIEPWIVADVPVEQPNLRGQWDVRVRPKVGDRGILSVFYHDISTLKEKGGFQAPSAIRVMAIDSASWRPGLPNHADVNAEADTYPNEDEWELKGNGVKVKLTSPANEDSASPNQMDVTVGNVQFTITVPKGGDPTIVFNAPNGAINITSATATINADVTINGTVTTSSTIQSGGDITSGGDVVTSSNVSLDNHMHLVPAAAAITPPPAPTPSSGTPIPGA